MLISSGNSVYQFRSHIILLLFRTLAFQEGGEKEEFQDKEHHKQFNQDDGPKCTSQSHLTKTVIIEPVNANNTLFNHIYFYNDYKESYLSGKNKGSSL